MDLRHLFISPKTDFNINSVSLSFLHLLWQQQYATEFNYSKCVCVWMHAFRHASKFMESSLEYPRKYGCYSLYYLWKSLRIRLSVSFHSVTKYQHSYPFLLKPLSDLCKQKNFQIPTEVHNVSNRVYQNLRLGDIRSNLNWIRLPHAGIPESVLVTFSESAIHRTWG